MKTSKLHLLLIIGIAFLLGFTVGTTKISFDWDHYAPHFSVINKEPPSGLQTFDMSLFWTVMQKLQDNFYDKSQLTSQSLLNGAIDGMVKSLGDPYTVYLPPTQNQGFKADLAGQFQGIGAELGMVNNQIVIIAPLDGSPAQKAGIKAGDAIVKVDDQSTQNWTIDQAVNKIRGKKGTQVKLSIIHKGEKAVKDIIITRDAITVKSVDGWVKKVSDIPSINMKNDTKDSVAYIRLSEFGDNTNQDWTNLINKLELQMQNNASVKGFILDLRDNPGGYLPSAIYVASEFIDNGVVVIEDHGNGNKTDYTVSRKGMLTQIPVIVLINKGTASASEIVSGALRDHGRAKLVGENSFGKGIVEEAEDLPNGAGLHITVAKWLTPNGTWVGNGKNGKGLMPDVTVVLDPKDPTHDTQLEKAVQELVQ